MNYHRMTVVGLRVLYQPQLMIKQYVRVQKLVFGLCKSPYELSQNDRPGTESSLSTTINALAICPNSVTYVRTLTSI